MAVTMRIGVKDFVYAELLTDPAGGTPTYGTVYSIPAVNQINYVTNSSITRAYGDDGIQAAAETVGDQSISVNFLQVPQADRNRLLGLTYAGGVLESKATSLSPYVAVGYKISRDNGSYQYVWFPKVKFSKPGTDSQTKANSVNFQMEMMEGAVVNLTANNVYRTLVETDDANASATTISNWFNAPVTASGADLGALSVTITKSSTNVLYTFAKVGGGNITLTAGQMTVDNLPVFKGASGAPQAGAYVIGSNGTAAPTVTFTPTVAFGTASVSAGLVGNRVFDQHGVACAAAGAVLSYP